MRILSLAVAATGLGLWCGVHAFPQQPVQKEDPQAGASHAKRGTPAEKAAFESHQLPSEKAGQGLGRTRRLAPPPGGEVTERLSPGERPALRFLKDRQASQAPQHPNRLENPHTRNPNEFTVDYDLAADAEVSVTIVGENGVPVRHYTIPPGQEGGRKGKNRSVYWDGRGVGGQEAPPGRYFGFQSIRYQGVVHGAKGKRETRRVPLHKKEQ